MDRFVLGLSVHTGWAASAVAAGSLREPRVALRERLEILGEVERFVFHRAAEAGAKAAAAHVTKAAQAARGAATRTLRDLVRRAREEGLGVGVCAIVAKDTPMPEPLDAVLASHARIHTAEGCFYRDVLEDAARAVGLEAYVIPPVLLSAPPAALAAAGRVVGRPWSKDEKLASLAAWWVLAGRA
jgi:hypothetical protein